MKLMLSFSLSLGLTLKLKPMFTLTDTRNYIRTYFPTLNQIHLETLSHTDIHIPAPT